MKTEMTAQPGTRTACALQDGRAAWEELRRKGAQSTLEILVSMLENPETRRNLAACRSFELSNGWLQFPCPGWLRHVAYVLEGGDGAYPEWARARVFDFCSTMANEFREGCEQPITATLASIDSSRPILKALHDLACGLLLPQNASR